MDTENKPYSVTWWTSNPDSDECDRDNDCMTGDDFATKDEAVAAFTQTQLDLLAEAKPTRYRASHLMLDGPDVHTVVANPRYDAKRIAREDAADRAAERSEFAMQQGMAFGTRGYNDAMGYDLGEEE